MSRPRRTGLPPLPPATLLLACTLLLELAPHDTRAQGTTSAATRRELLRLEEAWAAAVVKRDGAAFQGLLYLAPGGGR